MSGGPFVTYQQQDRVGFITLSRPDRRNAVSPELHADLEKAWQQFVEDDDAWVGILRGEGKSFCAGKDTTPAADGGALPPLERVFLNRWFVADTEKPLIVAIQGHAVGVGWLMVAGCDYRIAAEGAVFRMPEVPIGIVGPWPLGVDEGLPWAVQFELLVLGNKLDAERAQALGLVNEVVPETDLDGRAREIAASILELPPAHVRLTKSLMREARRQISPETLKRGDELRRSLEDLHDTREARVARSQRRKPQFVADGLTERT